MVGKHPPSLWSAWGEHLLVGCSHELTKSCASVNQDVRTRTDAAISPACFFVSSLVLASKLVQGLVLGRDWCWWTKWVYGAGIPRAESC